jgi:hypothetical protein
MKQIIADGEYYQSLREFCRRKKVRYDYCSVRLRKSDSFVYKEHHVRRATPEEVKQHEALLEDPIRLFEVVDKKVVSVAENPPSIPEGKRPPLLSKVETVGIGTIWRG